MLKVNYYKLFFFADLFLNSADLFRFHCSSGQPNNLPNTNLPGVVNNTSANENTFNFLLNCFLRANPSNTQQAVTHTETKGHLVNLSNNNAGLPVTPYNPFSNVVVNPLFTGNNNSALHSIPHNAAITFNNMGSVAVPVLHHENANSAMFPSSNANIPKNTIPFPLPNI